MARMHDHDGSLAEIGRLEQVMDNLFARVMAGEHDHLEGYLACHDRLMRLTGVGEWLAAMTPEERHATVAPYLVALKEKAE